MILRSDFQITIGQSDKGISVRVAHLPTGNEVVVDPVADEPVKKVVERLTAKLARRVYNTNDFVMEHIRAKPKGYLRVVHTPSGKYRDSHGEKTAKDLIDDLLNELGEVLSRRVSEEGNMEESIIKDNQGNASAGYTPNAERDAELYAKARTLFDPAETKRRKESERGKGCTIDQVMEHLKALEASE